MNDQQIKEMVDRFLNWKLPTDFNPDGGITFCKFYKDAEGKDRMREPVGTNLLTAVQAEGMIRHMLGQG